MWVDSRKRQDKAREAEPETGRTGKVLFAEKKKGCGLQNMDGDMCQKEMHRCVENVERHLNTQSRYVSRCRCVFGVLRFG